MKCVPLFSPEDSDLTGYTWYNNKDGYPYRNVGVMYKTTTYFAHRVVASRLAGRALSSVEIVDHQNFDRLDVRRVNLRITDVYGNAQHRKPNPFRGTTLHRDGKWQSQLHHKNKSYYLGLFENREDAAMAAKAKRDELGFLKANSI